MKIGIMGAMLEEIASLKALLNNIEEHRHGDRVYYSGTLHQHQVVLVFSRWGKVAAATTATALLHQFGIEQLIFIGVAGAVSTSLNIGDIVIADRLYQHDMDGRPIMPKRHEIPLTGLTYFHTDPTLRQKAHRASQNLFDALSQKIPSSTLQRFGVAQPQCCYGLIASGDQFIADKTHTERLLIDQPETLAVEMEGAAVAQVCHDYQCPFIVIRTISDKADHSAAMDFPAFIAEVACHYADAIITGMLAA